MTRRPTSITVIAWILIVTAAIALFTSTFIFLGPADPTLKDLMNENPIPIPIQIIMSYVGLFVQIWTALAMLKGRNWGRQVFVIWGILGVLIGLATSPMKTALIPGLVFFVVAVDFLFFRRAANQYFSECETVDNNWEVISAGCYVLAGFFVYALSLASFVREPDPSDKLAGLLAFAILGAVPLGIGLAFSRRRPRKSAAGIVLLSGAGVAGLVILSVACIFLSPETKELFPRELADAWRDYATGLPTIFVLAAIGTALVFMGRKAADKQSVDARA